MFTPRGQTSRSKVYLVGRFIAVPQPF